MRDDELVTIERYLFEPDAQLARATLEAAGIDAVLADEYATRLEAGGGHGHGGVRLQVRRRDASAAVEVLAAQQVRAVDAELDTIPAELVERSHGDSCRRCGSEEVYPAETRARRFWRALVLTMLALIVLNAASCVATMASMPLPPRLLHAIRSALPLGVVVGLLTTLVPPRMRCRNCGAEWRRTQRTA